MTDQPNPSRFKGDDRPVENVSWNDIQTFLGRLNAEISGPPYRLPTEAEWEYACGSGGKDQRYCGGDDLNSLAWYLVNSGHQTHPVGGKQANGLGLYDMSGNVWEWTCSRYEGTYSGAEKVCESNNDAPADRVLRGGSWYSRSEVARVSGRGPNVPDARGGPLGLRLAQDLWVWSWRAGVLAGVALAVADAVAWTEDDLQGARRLLEQKLEQRHAAAAKAKAEVEAAKQARDSVAQQMVTIPGGSFQMGCSPGDDQCFPDEKSPHQVNLKPFRLSRYEVTQAQWKAVMSDQSNLDKFYGDDRPVELVSHADIRDFGDDPTPTCSRVTTGRWRRSPGMTSRTSSSA
jgi:formylglycine-generating enzyme required for sulfatase activity